MRIIIPGLSRPYQSAKDDGNEALSPPNLTPLYARRVAANRRKRVPFSKSGRPSLCNIVCDIEGVNNGGADFEIQLSALAFVSEGCIPRNDQQTIQLKKDRFWACPFDFALIGRYCAICTLGGMGSRISGVNS